MQPEAARHIPVSAEQEGNMMDIIVQVSIWLADWLPESDQALL